MKRLAFGLISAVGLLGASGHAAAAADPQVYSLEQAIDLALANNPELNIMQSRIEQADAQFGESLAGFYPQIKTSLSFQYSNNPAQAFSMLLAQRRLNFAGTDFNHPGFVNDYRPQVSATYSLFRGGQDYHLSEAAKLGLETSELEKSAVRNHLVNNVTAAFYGELAAMESRKVSQRAIEAVQSQLDQTRARQEAGAELRSDVLSLEAQLAEARDVDIQAANAIELAQNMLKTLLGLAVGDPFAINQSDIKSLPEAPVGFDALLDQALANHPELKAAQNRVEMAEQHLSAAKAAYLPRADAFISYGSDSKNLTYNSNQDNLTTGVVVELDVFNGFATQEKVKRAEHELTAAKEAARQTRLHIENQLKTAQLRLQEALNRVKVSSAGAQSADEALRLVGEQRQAGVVTVTRFLEAEVARDRAQSRLINAHYDALRAEAELKQASGYWQ